LFSSFSPDEPESLVKIFSILSDMTEDERVDNALYLMSEVCFTQSALHHKDFSRYLESCLSVSPESATLPRMVQEANKKSIPAKARSHSGDWIAPFCEALANAFESEEMPTELSEAFYDTLLNYIKLDAVGFARHLLPQALRHNKIRAGNSERARLES